MVPCGCTDLSLASSLNGKFEPYLLRRFGTPPRPFALPWQHRARQRAPSAAVTYPITLCNGMLPGLGPVAEQDPYGFLRARSLKGSCPPLLAGRRTRGILGPARSSRVGRFGCRIMTERRNLGVDRAAGWPKRQSGSQSGSHSPRS
jgi:hypothetical protein